MSFIRIPLYFGRLNVKKARYMRRDERHGEVPVWRLGSVCVVWRPRQPGKVGDPASTEN